LYFYSLDYNWIYYYGGVFIEFSIYTYLNVLLYCYNCILGEIEIPTCFHKWEIQFSQKA
jgi:hypothetical protein